MSDEIAQIRRQLIDIPELLEEASHYLIPGSAPIDPTSVRGGTIFRIPIVPTIFDLLDEKDKALDDILLNRSGGERRLGVLPTLGLWVSLVYAELEDLGRSPNPCCPARSHTVAGETSWLAEWADAVVELHPCCDKCERGKRGCGCGCFAHDLEQLWVELRQACRIRPEYIPRCPKCGNRLEGVYGSESDKDAAWFRCTGCPETFVLDAELKRVAALQPPMMLRQIASFLGLPLTDLQKWEQEGRFSPVGSRRNVSLFEVEHVRLASQRVGSSSDLQLGKVVATRVGVAWSTLRAWQQKGLIDPVGKDAFGRKLFSVEAARNLTRNAVEAGVA